MDNIPSVKIELTGAVQGVGFRPYIHRLALKHNIKGWVANSPSGIDIRAEGTEDYIDSFCKDIELSAPPISCILEKKVYPVQPEGFSSFSIKESITDKKDSTIISPDIAICGNCREELFDPDNRRFHYPFITCAECGPRFTITFDIPYDRDVTLMNRFTMCSECYAEYRNIDSRRYHSQSNSCKICGPSLMLTDKEGRIIAGDPVINAIEILTKGKIAAIRGLGGFHLACDAENSRAVSKLRLSKNRKDKPFAVMAKDIETALMLAYISPEERALLESCQSPIILLKKRNNISIAKDVAPEQRYIGIMLPYTAVHHLLFDADDKISILVMTSGNRSNEPIAIENSEARHKLNRIADCFLLNNRDICSRCDDSVVYMFKNKPMFVRRARGYTPHPILTKLDLKQVLACGGEIKNTFCLSNENLVFISQHIGDLKTTAAFDYFKDTIRHIMYIANIKPEITAYDLHPQFLSAEFAHTYIQTHKIKGVGVQHHHAHIASCMLDNNIKDDNVIGIALDGTGYGSDNNLWGCEFIVGDYRRFERYAHLKYLPMPGGEAAIQEPIRMGISLLYETYGSEMFNLNLDILYRISPDRLKLITQMIERRINSPLTSSCGRLFDAVASLIGIRDIINYEAQASIELEMKADENIKIRYGYEVREENGLMVIDPSEMVSGIVGDITDGKSQSYVSGRFHNTIIDFSVDICKRIREKNGLDRVALSGGVFQNRFILSGMYTGLKNAGFNCLIHKNISCNDSGISAGQAVIASYSS